MCSHPHPLSSTGFIALFKHGERDKNATPAQISLAWMLAQKPYIIPIPGTRKEDRLLENIGAADIELTTSELSALNEALSEIKIARSMI